MTLHITEHEKEQQKKMAEEISKYSMQTFMNFQCMFPCAPLLRIEIHYKLKRSRPIFSIGSSSSVGQTDYYDDYLLLYEYAGSQKFWKDWNRYKNLKAFL